MLVHSHGRPQQVQKDVSMCQQIYRAGLVRPTVGVVVIHPYTGLRYHPGQHILIAKPVYCTTSWLLVPLVGDPCFRRVGLDPMDSNDTVLPLASPPRHCVYSNLLDACITRDPSLGNTCTSLGNPSRVSCQWVSYMQFGEPMDLPCTNRLMRLAYLDWPFSEKKKLLSSRSSISA